jgi:thiamine-phosphate pyrophosphorylase
MTLGSQSDNSPDLRAARFYGILDTSYVPPTRWVEICRQLITGGADLVQVRAKHETPREREELLRAVLPLFALSPAQPPHLIVNDDVELCVRVPGVGLHVGQDDTAPGEARARIGRDRVLGLSTHSLEQAQAAQVLPDDVLSYFCVGPVFATATKPDYTPVGLGLVREVAGAAPRLPWFCIGGITQGNVADVVGAGATRVVVVSEVLSSFDPAAAIRELRANLPAI